MASSDGASPRPLPALQAGFTYLVVLVWVALLSLVAGSALQIGQAMQRRANEAALLWTGREFSEALGRYAAMSPTGEPDAPQRLEELVRDPRFPGIVRHMRRLYADPVNGHLEWGLVREEDGGAIVGVFSLSEIQPLKQAGFDTDMLPLAGKNSYRQWVFVRSETNNMDPFKAKGLISPAELLVESPRYRLDRQLILDQAEVDPPEGD